LFDALKNNFFPDLTFYDDYYNATDCYSIKDRLEIELKCRFTHYDKMMIEENKYKNIIKRAAVNNRKPVYICSSPKGIFFWDIGNIVIKFSEIGDLPVDGYDLSGERITKSVGFLSVEDTNPMISCGSSKLVGYKDDETQFYMD